MAMFGVILTETMLTLSAALVAGAEGGGFAWLLLVGGRSSTRILVVTDFAGSISLQNAIKDLNRFMTKLPLRPRYYA